MGEAVQRRYSPEEVDQALMTLIAVGTSTEAAKVIKQEFGFDVPADTLRYWRSSRRERYIELVRQHGAELEQRAVDTKRALLPLLAEGIALGVEKTIQELEDGEAKDPSASARNLAVISGIETRDLLTLTGRPSAITATASPEDLYRQLSSILKGEDEEIPDAEVVTDEVPEGAVVPAPHRAPTS